jgi:alpha-D-glucose phosphate-specific phosphoglucomutase
MSAIRFGTDGWRATIAREFTFDNLGVVAQAVAGLLRDRRLPSQPADRDAVFIAYDARAMAKEFAWEVAAVLAGNGIPARIVHRPTPTPVLAHAIQDRGALGGFMLTASHNPPSYMGVKFIPWYAGPALSDITSLIESEVTAVLESRQVHRADPNPGLLDPRSAYFARIRGIVDLRAVRDAGLRLCLDPMHGVTGGYIDTLLTAAGCDAQVVRGDPNPTFGGGLPDPQPENLATLADKVRREYLDLGLANDADGDRFGIVDREGTYIQAGDVLAIATDYHLSRAHPTAARVARTLSTTHLVDAVCRRYGGEPIETPVGFKFLGEEIRNGALLAGEESGGLTRSDHIPEKDGIFACLLAAEIVATRGEPLAAQLARLQEEHGPILWFRRNVHFAPEEVAAVRARFEDLAARGEVAGRKVTEADRRDGLKLHLEDGSWILARPSGTEPVVRFYAEGRSEEARTGLIQAIESVVANG